MADSIHSVIIATGNNNILLPKTALLEVTSGRVTPWSDNNAAKPDWLVGTLAWSSLQIPVIDFDLMCGSTAAAEAERVAILNCVSNALRTTAFGVRCSTFPHLTTLSEKAIVEVDGDLNDSDYVQSYVKLGIVNAVIPDMEKIEESVALAFSK